MFGDVVGRSGRLALIEKLPGLRRKFDLDFVVVNAENAAGGFGITPRICEELFEAGADVLTTGNHAFDQRDDVEIYNREMRLLRPANFPASNPGRGSGLYQGGAGRNILVLHAQGQRGMAPTDDPCPAIERELEGIKLGREVDALIVDFHAEATSEKYSMAHYLDGRASLVVGTHTHVPTADEQILQNGTAFICDIGMCGDYDSVIGMEKSEPLRRFTTKMPGGRFAPAAGPATLCAVIADIDENTGLATAVYPLRLGGRLREIAPSIL